MEVYVNKESLNSQNQLVTTLHTGT